MWTGPTVMDAGGAAVGVPALTVGVTTTCAGGVDPAPVDDDRAGCDTTDDVLTGAVVPGAVPTATAGAWSSESDTGFDPLGIDTTAAVMARQATPFTMASDVASTGCSRDTTAALRRTTRPARLTPPSAASGMAAGSGQLPWRAATALMRSFSSRRARMSALRTLATDVPSS